MASYPTSVKAFTTKNDGAGNTIFAAHVDDLQDEVTAIEDGILNGTAPLHSSNTIVNNFSAAGGSTIAGVLNVAGVSSFAGAVGISGNVTVTGKLQSSNSTITNLTVSGGTTLATLVVSVPNDAVRAFTAAKVDIPNNAFTAITFDQHRFTAGNSLHSTGTTPTRFIAVSSGWYAMSAHVAWNTNSSGQRQLEILLNSTTRIARQVVQASAVLPIPIQSVATLYNLSVGDFVEVRVLQDSGSTGSLQVLANESIEFSMTFLR